MNRPSSFSVGLALLVYLAGAWLERQILGDMLAGVPVISSVFMAAALWWWLSDEATPWRTEPSSDADAANEVDSLREQIKHCSRELRVALQSSPDLVYRVSREGVFLEYFKPEHETALEPLASFDVVDRHVTEVFDEALGARVMDAIGTALEEDERTTVSFALHRDGRQRAFDARIVPLPSGDVFIMARDQTTTRAAQQEARGARNMLRDVSSMMPAVAYRYRLTRDGKQAFDFVSDSIIDVFGISAEDAISDFSMVWDLIHPDDVDGVYRSIEESARELRPWQFVYRILVDGDTRWIRGRSNPYPPAPDGSITWDGVLIDVTAEKNWERQLRDLETELAHAIRLSTIGEMMAVLAHEVNQPLGSMSYLAETLRRSLDSEKPDVDAMSESVNQLESQILHAADIIRRVRSYSARQTHYPDQLDPNALVEQTLELLEPESRRRNMTVRTKLAANLPGIIADRVMVQQILVNLVRNAFEALGRLDDHDVRPVTITTSADDDAVMIDVRDEGPGIDPDDRERFFEPFVTTKDAGIGLGLSISRRLAHRMDGSLDLLNDDRPGATFRVRLPRADV